ncbi:MAG: DUF2855 family protein [Acidimicrobiales bacterium]
MDFEVRRDELTTARVVELDPPSLEEGQVRLRIEAFALTSNNITYAVYGAAMRYWDFFPPSADGWGRIPAFGFAEVVESRHGDVEVGARVFGYVPMSTELVVEAQRVSATGFVDGSAHRQPMAAAYNHYQRVEADPAWSPEREPHQMLLRPLFLTSFLIDDALDGADWYGAERVLVSSASSKTSLGLAHRLARRDGVQGIGLTSPANVEFLEDLDIYDEVITYDEVSALHDRPSVYVDMSGLSTVRTAVHTHLGDALRHDMIVGSTHHDAPPADAAELPGPAPTMFFAPSQIAVRAGEWGRERYEATVAEAWVEFADWADTWLEVDRGHGPGAVEATYREVLAGRIDPAVGHVLSMHAGG